MELSTYELLDTQYEFEPLKQVREHGTTDLFPHGEVWKSSE
jgi:hypothetical protein